MGIPNDAVSNRILVFFVCWCLLALPIHYFTCAVERNSIPPLDSVLNKTVTFPIQIHLHCISASPEFCTTLHTETSGHIERQSHGHTNVQQRLKVNIIQHQSDSSSSLQNCPSSYRESSYLQCLERIESPEEQTSTYHLYFIHIKEHEEQQADTTWIVSASRSAWVNVNEHTKKSMLQKLQVVMDRMVYSELDSSHIDINIKDQIFSFTLLNSEPERGYNFEWNMHEIYDAYLVPFLNRISNLLLYDFHIDSQILHYGYIISQPPTDDIHVDRADFTSILANYIQKDKHQDYHFVTSKELQTFVGGTDWNRISSLVNDVAPIQFMVYIPPKKYLPLHIKPSASSSQRNEYDAFLVPRFGGCVIYNPSLNNETQKHLDTAQLSATFNIVLSQLRSMLGLRNDGEQEKGVVFLMDSSGINEWELDILIRATIVSDLETVQVSLATIYEMLDQVSQLPMNQQVASIISDAVYAFDEALKSCNVQRDYRQCVQWTRHSNYLAKKAEYHPSMLPALYFSPEFTYAVYSPYFLPGYIPIVAALFKKIKAKLQEFRQRKKRCKCDAYKSRKYDLELVAECLRTQCQRRDDGEDTSSSKTGKVSKQQLFELLGRVKLMGVKGSVENEKHIRQIVQDAAGDGDEIEYDAFLDLITDFEATEKKERVKCEWNLFRYNLIGDGRVDGKVSIFYRFDAWPEPQSFVVENVETTKHLSLPLQEVLKYIEDEIDEAVPYMEIRYALNPTFVPGKRGWQALDVENLEKAKVPLLINNDGTLEIDMWLRTKDFIENNQGIPLPLRQ